MIWYWSFFTLSILAVWIYNFSIYYHNDIAFKPIRKKYNKCYFLRWVIVVLLLIWTFLSQNNIFWTVTNKVSGLKSYVNNILNNTDNTSSNDSDDLETVKSNDERELLNFWENCEWWKVDRIVDWDTIVVEWEKIRLLWINTPETVDQDKPIECYWLEASERMKQLTLWRKVCLIKDTISDDLDKYWRKLRYVYLENWKSVNETMLEESYSREYSKYDFWYKDKYKEIADRAKEIWKWVYECPNEENNNDSEEEILSPDQEIKTLDQETFEENQIKEFVIKETPTIKEIPISQTISSNKNNCDIKWNINSKWEKIYHLPWCASYNDTIITTSKWEKRFCSEAEAKAAWRRKAKNC